MRLRHTGSALALCLLIAPVHTMAQVPAQSTPPDTVRAARTGPRTTPARRTAPARANDSIMDGLLIGAGVGAAFGWLGPTAMRPDDAESAAAISRIILLPAIGVGALIGALTDANLDQGHLTWQGKSRRWTARVDPVVMPGGGGGRLTINFR